MARALERSHLVQKARHRPGIFALVALLLIAVDVLILCRELARSMHSSHLFDIIAWTLFFIAPSSLLVIIFSVSLNVTSEMRRCGQLVRWLLALVHGVVLLVGLFFSSVLLFFLAG
jgi:hypothetical protein